jgi:predicted amidohydrolase YtcJ
LLVSVFSTNTAWAQKSYLLRPDRVFDGQEMHEGWAVLTKGEKIVAVGDLASFQNLESLNPETIELKGCTLLPGFIEGHSHLFLHPYNETPGMIKSCGSAFIADVSRHGTCETYTFGGLYHSP